MSRPSEIYETLSPTRLFFKYAVPNMISMAVISLYMIADGIFVGRFIGADALAGDGSGSTTAVNSFSAEDFKQSSKYPEQTGDDVTNFTRN